MIGRRQQKFTLQVKINSIFSCPFLHFSLFSLLNSEIPHGHISLKVPKVKSVLGQLLRQKFDDRIQTTYFL